MSLIKSGFAVLISLSAGLASAAYATGNTSKAQVAPEDDMAQVIQGDGAADDEPTPSVEDTRNAYLIFPGGVTAGGFASNSDYCSAYTPKNGTCLTGKGPWGLVKAVPFAATDPQGDLISLPTVLAMDPSLPVFGDGHKNDLVQIADSYNQLMLPAHGEGSASSTLNNALSKKCHKGRYWSGVYDDGSGGTEKSCKRFTYAGQNVGIYGNCKTKKWGKLKSDGHKNCHNHKAEVLCICGIAN
ncbi:hypothetical protein [Microbulbifer discodermiae]|uniref:hypothetical protein n=1 Tax=Microbulbifer sp. 2201CG32-9 TaxID=3232309 RepID=UPI00345BB3FA